MLIKVAHPFPIKPSEITPEAVHADRRRFLPTGVIMQPTGGSITSSTGPSKAREYQRRADIAEPLLS